MLREAYEKHKDVTRARQREQSLAGRDIGEIPKPVSPSRKGRCRNSLKMFLNVYFPEIFYLPWSPNHDRVIKKLETAIKEGGLFALAMPRGSGKTWICALGSLWAILYGWRRYVVFVSATDTMAVANMHKIHRQLETNRKLMGDFPEVCVPVARLEGITNRCRGQTYNGEKTYIRWGDNRLDMPSIPGSVCAGSIFESTSITSSNIRGKSHVTAFGVPLRPDFCLIDDPQSKESAASPEQCKKRLEIISADILRMAGPTETITAVMPCTVIERGDLSDQILDREKHPEWNGERMHLLDSFPDNLDLWDQYRAIWVESKRMHEGDIKDATTFYRKNREEMDKGAVCTWEQRYKKDEISGIQYAMNIFIENRKVFYSEFQNEPEEESDEAEQLNRDLIHQKLNGLNRLKVPLEASSITMYIDVHDKLLYYVIAAYAQGFTGAIIDYGTFPKQKVLDFEMNDARYIMKDIYSGMGRSARIYQALTDLTALHLNSEFIREDGAVMRISRCHIDANWGPETPVIYRFCRQNTFSNILTPCHGRGVLANHKPISSRKVNKGETAGLEWYISSNRRSRRAVRFCVYDTNYWKTFVSQRLKTAQGDPGSLSIYGNKPHIHDMLSSHICSEYFTPTVGQGRRVDVWQLRANRPDNHLFDCLVGTAVAASVDGITLEEIGSIGKKKKRKTVKLPAYIPS